MTRRFALRFVLTYALLVTLCAASAVAVMLRDGTAWAVFGCAAAAIVPYGALAASIWQETL